MFPVNLLFHVLLLGLAIAGLALMGYLAACGGAGKWLSFREWFFCKPIYKEPDDSKKSSVALPLRPQHPILTTKIPIHDHDTDNLKEGERVRVIPSRLMYSVRNEIAQEAGVLITPETNAIIAATLTYLRQNRAVRPVR